MPSRFAIVAAFLTGLGAGTMYAQLGFSLPTKPNAAIPATQPTSNASTAAPASQTVQTPAQRPARRAEVTFAQGQLAVKAENSSLNQILREIGRQTGIKITGGVADERVFGKYGPSAPSEVLASLLDGTSSNVLMLQSEAGSPGELILTPRQGGVTPPNPNAPGFDDEGSGGDDAPQPQVVQQTVAPQPPPQPQQPSPAASGGLGQPSATSATGTDAVDPNAVKTPQQIYEQLQRMRQQQLPPQQ